MSFLVIYVSNSESTSTSFSSQRDFIFVETFQGQRIKFPNFIKEKKKNNTKPHHTILATSNAAPIAIIGNFLVSLAQSRSNMWWQQQWLLGLTSTAFLMDAVLLATREHGILFWAPRPLPPEINSWCNKDSIMRFKNSWLMFPSGKLMGGLKFTERFEMEGRRENNW